MRFARTLFALAALCAAAACSGTESITAPEAASRNEAAPGGGWVGSDDVTSGGTGWTGSGNAVPADSSGDGRGGGGWIGSGN